MTDPTAEAVARVRLDVESFQGKHLLVAASDLRAILAALTAAQAALAAKEAEVARLTADLAEAQRRRDAWRSKAEGYDAVRKALREKVGAPWPPSLSRAMWAGIAADEKKRADDAEAEVARLRGALRKAADYLALVHDDATRQTFILLKANGQPFDTSVINNCQAAAWEARAALTPEAGNG